MCVCVCFSSVLTVNWKPMPKPNNKVVENQGLDGFFRSFLGKKKKKKKENQSRKEHLESLS